MNQSDAVRALLDELREAGQSQDMREGLWHRLSDEALLDRDDLAESLEQMAAGEVVPALILHEGGVPLAVLARAYSERRARGAR